MAAVISARKVGDPLPDGGDILGDRWTSAIVGDHLNFLSLNNVNQPTYRSFHETPLLGGVVASFDLQRHKWDKEIVYPSISYDENFEGKIFAFRRSLLLLTYQKHGEFSYRQLFFWDGSQWKQNSIFIDPKTQLTGASNVELFLATQSDENIHLLVHSRSEGSVIVSQLDTVGGYGNPGPARIDFLFRVDRAALKGDSASICSAVVFDHRIWILFFAHDDAAGAPARLLCTRLKDGHTEEIDLSAASGCGAMLNKPTFGEGVPKSICRVCKRQALRRIPLANGICASQWVFITNYGAGDATWEMWCIDLREGCWRLLATNERQSTNASQSQHARVSIPHDVEVAAWNDADMEFYGISFNSGVYAIDTKRAVDEY